VKHARKFFGVALVQAVEICSYYCFDLNGVFGHWSFLAVVPALVRRKLMIPAPIVEPKHLAKEVRRRRQGQPAGEAIAVRERRLVGRGATMADDTRRVGSF
jgi:hypothetical protein